MFCGDGMIKLISCWTISWLFTLIVIDAVSFGFKINIWCKGPDFVKSFSENDISKGVSITEVCSAVAVLMLTDTPIRIVTIEICRVFIVQLWIHFKDIIKEIVP